jgi:hypothetical protein
MVYLFLIILGLTVLAAITVVSNRKATNSSDYNSTWRELGNARRYGWP